LSTTGELCRWFEALFDGKIVGAPALQKYLAHASGESKAFGGRVIGPVGGNGIFNALQISVIDSDFHLTFFTSNSSFEAEKIYRDFREELISIAKETKEIK
jgi:hypothetical protein